jgi:acyl-coenzyme A thioesterase PaaI-like protein
MSQEPKDWLRSPEQGWIEIAGQDALFKGTFLSGEDGVLGIRYFRAVDASVRAKVIFGARTQGAPGIAHGGSIAALFDELMGVSVWATGGVAYSLDLRVRFRKSLPIPQRYVGDARVERVDGRKVWTTGRLLDVAGETVFAEAEGLYLELVDRAGAAAGRRA